MESIETTSGVQANCTFDVAGHRTYMVRHSQNNGTYMLRDQLLTLPQCTWAIFRWFINTVLKWMHLLSLVSELVHGLVLAMHTDL